MDKVKADHQLVSDSPLIVGQSTEAFLEIDLDSLKDSSWIPRQYGSRNKEEMR